MGETQKEALRKRLVKQRSGLGPEGPGPQCMTGIKIRFGCEQPVQETQTQHRKWN